MVREEREGLLAAVERGRHALSVSPVPDTLVTYRRSLHVYNVVYRFETLDHFSPSRPDFRFR